ncbi:MAG: imidazole glycerol phosphate synthase subunit HisH [Candidatus Omnitrophica bacterium]|nr:imidazole glycerol phosphate synthase subunit HisH [Candidatus Omnitrophota bacterium]
MIGIINYGAGNVFSVLKSVEKTGKKAKIMSKPEKIRDITHIILPGVGAFDDGIKSMRETGMDEFLKDGIKKGRYILGICLGLQLFFERSEEGSLNGFNFFSGGNLRFSGNSGLSIPHMGWNTVLMKKQSKIFKDIPARSFFYFAHSYYPVPADRDIIIGVTGYGVKFASVVEKNNIIGLQFHPEKSSVHGQKIIENFVNL